MEPKIESLADIIERHKKNRTKALNNTTLEIMELRKHLDEMSDKEIAATCDRIMASLVVIAGPAAAHSEALKRLQRIYCIYP